MFKWLFGETDGFDEEFDEVEEASPVVSPVVEQRRKEKFNEPFYNSEFPKEEPVEEVEKPKVEEKKVVKPKPKVNKAPAKKNDEYQMRQIISPMAGLVDDQLTDSDGTKVEAPRKKKMKLNKDDLVPVLSPFYGMSMQEDTESEDQPQEEKTPRSKSSSKKAKPSESAKKVQEQVTKVPETPVVEINEVEMPAESFETIDDRLRNIGKLTEETQDDLKIIEERTGKFNLDFKNEEESSDAIDDNMSLDELMNLYEKKFKG